MFSLFLKINVFKEKQGLVSKYVNRVVICSLLTLDSLKTLKRNKTIFKK